MPVYASSKHWATSMPYMAECDLQADVDASYVAVIRCFTAWRLQALTCVHTAAVMQRDATCSATGHQLMSYEFFASMLTSGDS
jgi:hypothetical protein